jgi:mannose-6-phosphate isomerase-like protein (cupin superfamily)
MPASTFETRSLPRDRNGIATDGSEVRVLLSLKGRCSMAHFRLMPGQISRAITHKTVHEIWFVLSGDGEMWRSQDGRDDHVASLAPGVCVTLPLGTRFQFRASPTAQLDIVGVTSPPWPNTSGEARVVEGKWQPNVP